MHTADADAFASDSFATLALYKFVYLFTYLLTYNSTIEWCRVGVGCVYMNSQLAHDDCRRIRSTIWKLTVETP